MEERDEFEDSYFSQINSSLDAIVEDEDDTFYSMYKENPENTNEIIYGESPDFAAIRKASVFKINPFWVPRSIIPGYWNAYFTSSFTLVDKQALTRKENIIKGVQKAVKKEIVANRGGNTRIFSAYVKEDLSDMGVFIRLYHSGIDVFATLDAPARRVLALYSLQLFGENGKDINYIINDYRTAISYLKDYNHQVINPDNREYLMRNGIDYDDEFKKMIIFPDNFITPEKFKRGKQALSSVKFEYKLNRPKGKLTAKLLYKSKNRKKYYINTEFLFNGNHWNLTKVPELEKILESSWNDPDVPVKAYLEMQRSISVRAAKGQLHKIPFKKAQKYLVSEKGTNNKWQPGIDESNKWYFESQGSTRYSERAIFIKIYQEGVYPIFSLGKNGMLVLGDVFHQLLSAGHDRDRVNLNYNDKHFLYIARDRNSINKDINRRQAFYKGIQECINHSLICRGRIEGEYYINPLFFFHGNRKDIKS